MCCNKYYILSKYGDNHETFRNDMRLKCLIVVSLKLSRLVKITEKNTKI